MTVRFLLISAMLLCLFPAVARAQHDIDSEKYAKVRAGIVLNFVRYTTWPETRFDDSDAPIVITVLGRDLMIAELNELVEREIVRGRRIELRQLDYPEPDPRTRVIDQAQLDRRFEELRASHLIYIASTERLHARAVLRRLEGEDILTVSDIADFASDGGMLGLSVRGGRIAIDANTTAIGETKLSVSSKLLRLATIVHGRERGKP